MSVPIDVHRHPRVAGTGPGGLPVPPDLLQARAARLRDAAASAGLAALAIFSQPSASSYLGGLVDNLVDIPMQAGMTIELHPNVCPPGLGLRALGDVFVVTPEGGERLTMFPRDLHGVTPA